MVFPVIIWLLLAVSFLVSAIGFKKYVYFFSVGYGFSIAVLSILLMFLFPDVLTWGTIACCAILAIYGSRLGGYLLHRELKTSSYGNKINPEVKDTKALSFGVKFSIWASCAILYILQISPIFYRLYNGDTTNIACIIGLGLMILGFVLELIADNQKQRAKKKNPHRFCDTGLYRFVRCPNYLGEILLWTGVLVSGIGSLTGWQWVLPMLGYIGIVFVMFSGARRLELRQNKCYGNDPEYQKYVKKVPILLPFIPLYSVAKYKFLVA